MAWTTKSHMDCCGSLCDESSFGDHTGYYTLPEPYPVFHVTAITHRKSAVHPVTIVGILISNRSARLN